MNHETSEREADSGSPLHASLHPRHSHIPVQQRIADAQRRVASVSSRGARARRYALALGGGMLLAAAAGADGISYKQMADAMHAVMEADRTAYTRNVVNRLQNDEKVIKASEHWKDDKALPLPAQMFRMGAEMVAEKNLGFTYSLQSLWPINKQNAPRTDAEKQGLKAVAAKGAGPYYTEETLGKTKYFTAVYPDVAISPACVGCHNDHRDSPRTDFKLGEVMGGVVVRIPMK